MSISEALAFIYIGTQADTRNGIWKGSAKSLAGELGMSERTARAILERLEHGDYIRRLAVPGRHTCYPIMVHKFLITNGEHNGEQLNALESISAIELAYFSREQGVEPDGQHGAAQKRSKTRNGRREKKEGAPASLSLCFSGQHFTITQKQDPGLTGLSNTAKSIPGWRPTRIVDPNVPVGSFTIGSRKSWRRRTALKDHGPFNPSGRVRTFNRRMNSPRRVLAYSKAMGWCDEQRWPPPIICRSR